VFASCHSCHPYCTSSRFGCTHLELPFSQEHHNGVYVSAHAMQCARLSLSAAGAGAAAHSAAALQAEPERVLRFPIVEGLFPTLVYFPGGPPPAQWRQQQQQQQLQHSWRHHSDTHVPGCLLSSSCRAATGFVGTFYAAYLKYAGSASLCILFTAMLDCRCVRLLQYACLQCKEEQHSSCTPSQTH
jgi:hypothetical protein